MADVSGSRERGASCAPNCDRFEAALDRARRVADADRATCDLRRYIMCWRGGQFDRLVDSAHPDEFTDADFLAVRRLNVSVLRAARAWLSGEGLDDVRQLLRRIPPTLDISEIPPEDYCKWLGPSSDAWKLWELLFERQKGARHSGRGVTAGKLLHGKRPRLVPIFDRARVFVVLGVRHAEFWEAIWCLMRCPLLVERLREIREAVPEARDLSLLRILDIVVWMSVEPASSDVCCTQVKAPAIGR